MGGAAEMQLDVALEHPTSCCDVLLPEDAPKKTRGQFLVHSAGIAPLSEGALVAWEAAVLCNGPCSVSCYHVPQRTPRALSKVWTSRVSQLPDKAFSLPRLPAASPGDSLISSWWQPVMGPVSSLWEARFFLKSFSGCFS